jgi:mono/diheme cytochrome c family protein
VPGSTSRPESAASCKVSVPVCDPAITDDAALAVAQERCAGCHAEGGAASHPFLNAPALLHERGNIALRLAGCEMPPDATPLPADERARLIRWGGCGLPETGR